MSETAHPTSRYRAVLLDAGGTLLGPRESYGHVYASVLEGVGIRASPQEFERAIHETMDAMESEIPEGADRFRHFPGGEAEFWLRFARRAMESTAGLTVDPATAMAALEGLREAFRRPEAWEVFPDVVPTLTALRERKVPRAIVSNWDGRLPEILEMLELAPLFDAIVVSHLEGVEKPSPELFHIALRRLGVAAGDAVHVGDRPDQDIAGAEAAGVDGLLIDRQGGDGALRDLTPLLGMVG